MLRKIEELRKQPKEVRNRRAFYVATVVTAIIAGVWAISVPAKFAAIDTIGNPANDQSGSFSRAIVDVKEQFASLVDSLRSESLVAPTPTDRLDKSNQIDIEAMFDTDTSQNKIEEKEPARAIRIATTSTKTATSGSPIEG